MPRRGHVKHVGLTDTIVSYLRRWPQEKTFMAVDMVERLHVPMRSVYRALSYLIREGFIEVVGQHRVADYTVAIYQLTGQPRVKPPRRAPKLLPEEAPGVVHRKDMGNGVTRVSFGMSWKPHREKSESRPWRGYESGLARL